MSWYQCMNVYIYLLTPNLVCIYTVLTLYSRHYIIIFKSGWNRPDDENMIFQFSLKLIKIKLKNIYINVCEFCRVICGIYLTKYQYIHRLFPVLVGLYYTNNKVLCVMYGWIVNENIIISTTSTDLFNRVWVFKTLDSFGDNNSSTIYVLKIHHVIQ